MKKYFILVMVVLVTCVGASSQTIKLKRGWNLVGTNKSVSDINTLIPTADAVWKYESSTWSVTSPNGFYTQAIASSGLDSFSSVEAGSGFWVDIKNDSNITLTGTPDLDTNISIQFGWSLLSLKADYDISTMQPFNNPNIRSVWKYTNGAWCAYSGSNLVSQMITDNNLNFCSSIKVGEGFWIDSTSDLNISTIDILAENDANVTQINDSNFSSEIVLHKNSFVTDTENWKVSYTGACALSFSDTENNESNGSLFVSSRAHNYDGAFFNITNMIEVNKLYVIRAYIKQTQNSSDNYQLMAKISSSTPQYILLNRIKVDNTAWNKLRAFVSFTKEQIDAGVEIYINSDTNKNDYYLDEVAITRSAFDPSLNDSGEDILKIKDSNIVDKNNSIVRLKGINLVAYGDNDSDEASTFMNYSYYNYDRDDFKNIKSLGFSSIRLALWYKYFEDDSNPYNYKESGFEWLNTIIGWAKEAGLHVVLDMHAPEGGGFQGPNNITPFWSQAEYQNRFIALWKEIALRYKNADTIAAYDLINEPCAHNQAEYLSLIKKTIDEIRTIDSKHIINVEEGFSDDAQQFLLSEYSNILYDFHFYDPWSFTNSATTLYNENGVNDAYVEELFRGYANFYAGYAFHVSEFGQMRENIDTKNSELWIKKVFNLLNEYGASYHYWNYKGRSFGLYDGTNAFSENSNFNTELKDIFLNNN